MPHDFEIPLGEISGFVTRLDQFFGPWAVEEMAFQGLFSCVGKMNLAAHVAESQARALRLEGARAETATENHQGTKTPRTATDYAGETPALPGKAQRSADDLAIAMIRIEGPITKYGSSVTGLGTVETRRQIRNAVRDPEVGGLLLVIDSPGGTVHGTGDLAAEVARAAERKPVYAFVEDLGCSAAYWVASQATRVYCNASARVGSLGTFLVLYDSSEQAKQEGVRAVVIRAGAFKGAGTAGAPITEEQESEFQRLVNESNAQFLSGVASGRGVSLELVQGWADGRAYGASESLAKGLVDAISTQEAVLADLISACAGRKTQRKGGSQRMEAATYAAMKAECPGASAEFFVRQLELGASLDQVKGAFQAEQAAALEAANAQISALESSNATLKAEISDLKSEVEALKRVPKGLAPVAASGAGDGDSGVASSDPVAAWDAAVSAEVAKGKSKADAVRAVAKADPALQKAYVAAMNERRPKRNEDED